MLLRGIEKQTDTVLVCASTSPAELPAVDDVVTTDDEACSSEKNLNKYDSEGEGDEDSEPDDTNEINPEPRLRIEVPDFRKVAMTESFSINPERVVVFKHSMLNIPGFPSIRTVIIYEKSQPLAK